ncbi:MAG: hypothetical protein U9R27_04490 [Campylobacterota bacterium]|nr:hypothetical protein [Campylobacterota bacterium]
MSREDLDKNRGRIGYDEEQLLLGIDMVDKLKTITEMMLYFLDQRQIKFTYILIRSDSDDFEAFLKEEKRDTDVLISLAEKGLFVIVCQETDIEGGYRFAERLVRHLNMRDNAKSLSCNVMTVSTTYYSVQHIIFRLLDSYHMFTMKDPDDRMGPIEFQTLS